ncbi:nanos C2HC-type zinc finger 2, partial [Chelydra serpentina]
MLPAWLSVPPSPPVAIAHDFNMWRDYLNLSKVLGEIIEEHRKGSRSLLPCETADLCLPGTPLPMSPGDTSSPKSAGWNRSNGSSCPQSGQNRAATPQTPGSFICNFCRHNGESRQVYSSHLLKQADGTVLCP